MQIIYQKMMQEVDSHVSAIDLNGKGIIEDCKMIITFLNEKLTELKEVVKSGSFSDVDEEITFFKHQKPMLLGRLIYFYKVLHIESNCPPCGELADEYYRRQQEELKLFFDQHVEFYQYYRSGATYRDDYYFRCGAREISPETGAFLFDDDMDFSTGYDRLIARIVAMEMLYAYLTTRRKATLETEELPLETLLKEHHWTDKKAAAIELIYAIHSAGSVDGGQVDIIELVTLFEIVFHVELGDAYRVFAGMRNRKMSRTAYLDELKEKLLRRMDETDG